MFIVKATSECGTYRETLKCLTMDEACSYKAALESDGWKVKITEARSKS